MITPVPEPGDATVSGHSAPCMLLQVFAIPPGSSMPSDPPCMAPDTVIGSGPSNGSFSIAVPPLALNQCIYVCDTCTMLASDVACAHPPAPAPAMSPQMSVVAMLVLGLVALVSMLRLKRDI